jgi:hypothetical protein
MKIFGKKVQKEISYKGQKICVTKDNVWIVGEVIEDFPPQWAESVKDAKGMIDYLLSH